MLQYTMLCTPQQADDFDEHTGSTSNSSSNTNALLLSSASSHPSSLSDVSPQQKSRRRTRSLAASMHGGGSNRDQCDSPAAGTFRVLMAVATLLHTSIVV
jgi:hypothetical protein